MGSIPGREHAHAQIVRAAVYRRIDDPDVDQDDCRKAVIQLGQRIAAGEPPALLLDMCDRWLDLYAVLEFRDELRRRERVH